MAGIESSHPSVDAAMKTATHGRGGAHSTDHGMRTATHGRGAAVVKPSTTKGTAEAHTHYGDQNAKGPMIKSGQKGHPLTD
jgi:hypothetical protein